MHLYVNRDVARLVAAGDDADLDAVDLAFVEACELFKGALRHVNVGLGAARAVVDNLGRDHLVVVVDVDCVAALELATLFDSDNVVRRRGLRTTACWVVQLTTAVPGDHGARDH